MVVIAIVAVLMTVAFVVGIKQADKGKQVQALGQFHELAAGMEAFIQDNQKPPVMSKNWSTGMDTVYGEAGGENPNSFIIAALKGDMSFYRNYKDESGDAKTVNPNSQQYSDFTYSAEKKKGVGDDGCLYDPWGKQIMIAVNTPPYIEDSAGGVKDKLLYTEGEAEYTDTKPTEQTYVFWSFGKDGKKGKNGANITAKVPYAGSDDVISW